MPVRVKEYNFKMISYVIASYRPDAVEGTLKSIAALPPHPHEVVVCTPHPKADYGKVRFILDDKLIGSTYAFNKGVKEARGNWIVVGIDDHAINYNVYEFMKLIYGQGMNEMEYQVVNLGSPWTDCISRNAAGYGINMGNTSPEVLGSRWSVVTFPAVSVKTIKEKFDGHLFHPDLLHHFVDHWMGLYVSRKQLHYDFNQFGPHAAWNQHWPGDNCDRTRDDTDSRIFCNLAARFIQNPDAYGYTTPL
jgi:hypothetical protein